MSQKREHTEPVFKIPKIPKRRRLANSQQTNTINDEITPMQRQISLLIPAVSISEMVRYRVFYDNARIQQETNAAGKLNKQNGSATAQVQQAPDDDEGPTIEDFMILRYHLGLLFPYEHRQDIEVIVKAVLHISDNKMRPGFEQGLYRILCNW